MWQDMFTMQISTAEKVLRTVAVYGGLAVLLRLAGKRDLAQLNTFDLVVILLLSNVVQNAVIGPDNSLTGGLLGAVVLLGVNAVWVRVANSSKRLSRLAEGDPTVLVRDGEIVANLTRLGLRRADITTALRIQGADRLADVREATLHPGGSIVVDLAPQAQDVTVAELAASQAELVAQLRAEIDRLGDRLERALAELRPDR